MVLINSEPGRVMAQQLYVAVDHPAAWGMAHVKGAEGGEASLDRMSWHMLLD